MVMIIDNPFLCIFPLSGHYALLQRIHFYLVLLFAARAPTSSWLVGAAFADAMSISAVATVHALVLLCSSRSILDLDVAGAWALLAPSALLVPVLLSWTPALHASSARSLIRLWGLFITLGAVSAFTSLIKAYPSIPDTPPCPVRSSPVRDDLVLHFTPRTDLFGSRWTPVFVIATTIIAFLGLFTVPACLFDVSSGSSSSYPSTYAADPTNIARTPSTMRSRWLAKLRSLGAFFSLPLAAISIGFVEKWIAQLPSRETPRSVGQWSIWAATALVVVAAVIKGSGVETTKDQGHSQGSLIRIV